MTEALQLIRESQLTCALLVFGIAFGESFFASSYLLPGTILTVGLGGLIKTGTLPPWIALLTWAGTWTGDAMSYYVARRLGGLLRRNRKLARILDWGQAAFARKPAMFMFVSRHVRFQTGSVREVICADACRSVEIPGNRILAAQHLRRRPR